MAQRATPSRQRLLLGVDENGLGPRLGPMTVTAALLAVSADEPAFRRACADAGIGDSKGLCAHGAMRDVEALVLALLDVHLGLRPTTLDELLRALSLHDDETLRARCPREGDATRACFGATVALPAFGPGSSPAAVETAGALRRAGVALRGVRVALACAKALNVARAAGQSRFDVDLDLMLALTVALRGEHPGEALAVACGKVGGRRSYTAALTRVAPLVATLEEGAARSAYRVPAVGTVAFVRDGDATEPAISLASLVGKYVRELSMERIYRYYAERVPGLARASGYHDPVTARFVEATGLVRRTRAIADECFER